VTDSPPAGPGDEADEQARSTDPSALFLRNEFAHVRVSLHDPGDRPRLQIEDLRTQQTVELDPMELESLAWARHIDLAPLLDPGLTRWADLGG